ncbi:MAG: RagB/SusD family nutrient uptake outer membrane protein [Tannerellaceae bacterium]|nr:RagB/SusD family nutrient uptake outer membrane protein [Tannerellaceae bacterium]
MQEDRWQLQEMAADAFCLPTRGPHWYDGAKYQRLYYHQWTPYDSYVWETWKGTTMGISLAIEVKEDLEMLVDYDALGFTPEEREAQLMELQTLVAYFYMRGLDFFRGMPIFTASTQTDLYRNTDKETFDHIESLLLEAIPKLPVKTVKGTSEDGSIKQAAGAMLLAQLYFNAGAYIGENRFADCAKICQDILDGKYGTYELEPTWYGVHHFDNDRSPEVIWCTPSQNAKRAYNWFWKHFYHSESYKYFDLESGGDNGGMIQPSRKPTGEIYTEFRLRKGYEKFHDQDLRKKPYVYKGNKVYEGMFLVGEQTNPLTGVSTLGIQEYQGEVITFVDQVAHFRKVGTEYASVAELPSTIATGEETSGVRLVKVPQPNLVDKSFRNDADNPVLRLAEVYYMLAECKYREGKAGEAANLINTVRRRNFEGGQDPDPVTSDNLDEYRLSDEWFIEFMGEGRRRTDLIRWDKFVTEDWWNHKATNSKHLNRFPVPAEAIAGNNLLEQNPGY